MTLSVGGIVAAAEAQAGFGESEPWLHRNLAALIESLNRDGTLDADGMAAAERNLTARTADRLFGLKWVAEHPAIAAEPIEAPVFLTGLPRSGTTYFQYLFDHDPSFRLIRTWQGIMPQPPPGADPESVTRRKAIEAEIRGKLRPREIEGFAALHLHDADGPEECHAFLEQAYAAAGFFNLYDAPGYFEFLMDELDLAAAYRVHKRQLQLLQWQLPRRRWALKYPNHVITMDAILEVYPEARFAMTHRDPVQVLASIAKMTLSLRQARYAAVDPHRVGRQMLHFIRRHIDRILAFDSGPNASRVTHVDYYRLVAEPAAEMAQAYRGLGLEMPDEVAAAIAAWRRDNPKGARGRNDYALEQFGLSAEETTELFADYSARFAIPSEAEGIRRDR
ncbi:MAG: sulfotransferase [Novosphingobium sp.]|nr:sulfotransferase [Novosphingobium sp.]